VGGRISGARRPPVCPAFPRWLSGRALVGAVIRSGGVWLGPVNRGVEVGPGRLPGPLLGHVQGQAAGGAREPGGDVDQVSADGGGGGAGVEGAGQRAGGAVRLCAIGHNTAQAALAWKDPEGRWASALAAASAMTCSMIA
jgi:hypothetical protein